MRLLGRQSRVRGSRPALDRRGRRSERGPRTARRGRHRQERAARLRRRARPGERTPRPGGGRRVRDGAGLQRSAPALRAHARSPRTLPSPSGCALETVFGLSEGPPADRFLVGLATLDAVRRGRGAATARLHRRRRAVARPGLGADRSGSSPADFSRSGSRSSCAARRTASATTCVTGCPSWTSPVSATATPRTLLLENVLGPLDAAVCQQIVAESHGNPLALLELPRTWSVADLAGGFGLPDRSLPCPAGSRRATRVRLSTLPSDTQLLRPGRGRRAAGDPVLLHRAAETLGLDMAAAEPRRTPGCSRSQPACEFAHPLVRSAAYRSAGDDDRHRVHHALAEATDGETDPDRRAWHRARGDRGARRGGRRRARTFGRPGPGSRRGRRRRRVPAARRRADQRPGATRGRALAGGAGQLPGRRVRRRARPRGRRRSRTARRAASAPGPTWCAAGSPSPWPAPTRRSSLLLKAAQRRDVRPRPRPRDLPDRLVRRGRRRRHAKGAERRRDLPRRPGAPPAAGLRRPLDLIVDGLALLDHRGTGRGHSDAATRAATALLEHLAGGRPRWGWMAAAASIAVWDNEGRADDRRQAV